MKPVRGIGEGRSIASRRGPDDAMPLTIDQGDIVVIDILRERELG